MHQLPLFEKGLSLKEFCTYGIGGPAREFVTVQTIEEMQEVLKNCFLEGKRFFILGKGSNTLFDDRGFDGVVILNKIQRMEREGERVKVGGGYSLSLLASQVAREGLGGLEFGCGIPGSVGGAIYMNAGAGGVEISDRLEELLFVDEKGELHRFERKDLSFSYRRSPFHDKKGAIVSATFQLTPRLDAKEEQRKLLDYRMKTQPYKDKSCGCVFRNVDGVSAGKLIEQSGLKGFQIGGARISSLHANFLVNEGEATAQDILDAIAYIRTKVWLRTGKMLQPEVCYVPYEGEQ